MHFGRRRDEGIALRTRNDVIRQHARAPFENSDKADLGDIQKSASGERITKAWGGVEIKWRKSWHAAAPIDQERLQMPKSGNAFQPPVRLSEIWVMRALPVVSSSCSSRGQAATSTARSLSVIW